MSSVEEPNKNAGGINVSTASDVSKTAAAGRNLSPVTCNLSPAVSQEPKVEDPGLPRTKSQKPVFVDPRFNSILDDPRSYFRHYPDDRNKSILHQLVTEDHLWPQPADDKMPPDKVFRLEDGTRMPFTTVNRQPKTNNALGDLMSARWPVTLHEQERLQIAVARFYELHAAAIAALHRGSNGANQVSASSDSLASRGPSGRRERSELALEKNANVEPGAALPAGASPASSVETPNKNAPGNNVSTTSEVSAISANQRGSAAKDSAVVLPKTVPNPQPIPFPSQKELEAQGYRFGPFSPEHNPTDIEMIAYYARRGYRPLQPHEVDYAEFRCNGVPFAKASDVPHRPKPQEPPAPQKSPEQLEQAERDAVMAKIRRDREAPPKCAANGNIRLAPAKRT